MKQGSKLVIAALAAGALGAAATAFAHPGDRAGGDRQGAAAGDCPMHTAMQQGEHRMGQGGRGRMEHRGMGQRMGQGMRHGETPAAPKAEEAPKQ
jgi:hypothetical protein